MRRLILRVNCGETVQKKRLNGGRRAAVPSPEFVVDIPLRAHNELVNRRILQAIFW